MSQLGNYRFSLDKVITRELQGVVRKIWTNLVVEFKVQISHGLIIQGPKCPQIFSYCFGQGIVFHG